jgi:hypothetical protein
MVKISGLNMPISFAFLLKASVNVLEYPDYFAPARFIWAYQRVDRLCQGVH